MLFKGFFYFYFLALESGPWPRRRCSLKICFFFFFFFFFFALDAILFRGTHFGRKSLKKHSCKIIAKSINRFRRSCLLGKLLSEQNHFSNFGRGSLKEHSCNIILTTINPFRRRCLLRKLLIDAWQSTLFFIFLALVAILFSQTEPF